MSVDAVAKIVELGSRLLEAERSLEGMRIEFAELCAKSDLTAKFAFMLNPPSPQEELKRRGRRAGADSPSVKVLTFLNQHPTLSYNAPQLSRELDIEPKRVQTACNNLTKAGKIRRLGRGEYQALEIKEVEHSV